MADTKGTKNQAKTENRQGTKVEKIMTDVMMRRLGLRLFSVCTYFPVGILNPKKGKNITGPNGMRPGCSWPWSGEWHSLH